VSRYYQDAAWAPDGRALIAYAPDGVYTATGEDMYRWGEGDTPQERLANLAPYLPAGLGIAAMDYHGKVQMLFAPPAATMYRYPVWIGKRSRPWVQPMLVDETRTTVELHIADFRTWLSFQLTDTTPNRSSLGSLLDTVTHVRVLQKELEANACLSNGRVYRNAVLDNRHDHPTHLGISTRPATGTSCRPAWPTARHSAISRSRPTAR